VASLPELTAVVVDWNLPELTIRAVRSLVADGVSADSIVVVENGPSPENWSRIRAALEDCVLVRVEPNVGFARANNIGARVRPARAYLLVNNDAFVHRAGSVAVLVQAILRPDVGVAVPRLLNEDLSLQPSVSPLTTPLPALVRASGVSRWVPDRWQPRFSTHWSHSRSREVQAAIGAVMIVDGAAWDQIGGLSEASFMYAEDLDLCWRVRSRGWKTWFVADAEFIHLGESSASRRWSTRERSARIGRAEAEMMRQHLSPSRAATAIGFMRLGLAARVACFTVIGNTSAAASCRGSLEGLAGTGPIQPVSEAVDDPQIEIVTPR
jgi:N-acetylglucosaminyl-diphospho-decaprenol L-rhamnosyltransferase